MSETKTRPGVLKAPPGQAAPNPHLSPLSRPLPGRQPPQTRICPSRMALQVLPQPQASGSSRGPRNLLKSQLSFIIPEAGGF